MALFGVQQELRIYIGAAHDLACPQTSKAKGLFHGDFAAARKR